MNSSEDPQERGEGRSLLEGLLGRLRELTGRREENGRLRETLEDLLHETEDAEARLSEKQREILRNALTFGALDVADVMVPRPDIAAVAQDASLEDVIAAMRQAMHTRLPVYRATLDDVVGIVHIKDLLAFWDDGSSFDLAAIVRPVLYVPPSMRVLDLLLEMRDVRVHMAIVVDEFGGTDGLATIEDLVEEIVGEIQDEHDRITPPSIAEFDGSTLEADGRVEVEALEEHLGLRLLDDDHRDDADTIGGLIFTLLDRVPARGEVVRHPAGVTFEIVEADPRRIRKVRILPEPAGPAESAEPGPST